MNLFEHQRRSSRTGELWSRRIHSKYSSRAIPAAKGNIPSISHSNRPATFREANLSSGTTNWWRDWGANFRTFCQFPSKRLFHPPHRLLDVRLRIIVWSLDISHPARRHLIRRNPNLAQNPLHNSLISRLVTVSNLKKDFLGRTSRGHLDTDHSPLKPFIPACRDSVGPMRTSLQLDPHMPTKPASFRVTIHFPSISLSPFSHHSRLSGMPDSAQSTFSLRNPLQ